MTVIAICINVTAGFELKGIEKMEKNVIPGIRMSYIFVHKKLSSRRKENPRCKEPVV